MYISTTRHDILKLVFNNVKADLSRAELETEL